MKTLHLALFFTGLRDTFFMNSRQDGDKFEMPHFFGQRGPMIARSMLEIEGTFEKHLLILKTVKKGILDVKNTSWHDDYTK